MPTDQLKHDLSGTLRCGEAACPVGSFTEQNENVAKRRALLTRRACWWAIGQIRREHASVAGVCRQLGTTWNTVWSAIKPLLMQLDEDRARFDGVTTLGVEEHIWHHVSTKPADEGGRGPKALTGMVDLTRDEHGQVHAKLLDLVPGRSRPDYANWLKPELDRLGQIAECILESFPTCPIPEIRRLGKPLNRWKAAFLSYWSTQRSNNGGTEAVNGLIELHRRIARGFRNRDNYRLRMLLIGGGLTHPHLN